MRRALLLLLVLVTGCAGGPAPQAAVTEAQARSAVQRVVEVAAGRSPAAMRELCRGGRCAAMSSGILGAPQLAPDRSSPPRELCLVPLPPDARQRGAKLLVLEGVRGDGRSYVTQVLVERDGDEVVLHEPGFWIGIRYTALQEGRAWDGASDVPALRATQDSRARVPCEDAARWLREVTGA